MVKSFRWRLTGLFMIISFICFTLAIAAYSISQLQQHNKLRWMRDDKQFDFWGKLSHRRKYKRYNSSSGPRYFLSTSWLVAFSDGYHFCQFIAGLFISLSFVPLLGWTYGIAFWILAHVIHFTLYRTLQR